MAKYRITSIPQYAPGGETDWPKWLKRKKKSEETKIQGKEDLNSIINYTTPSEETKIQGIESQSGLEFIPNAPALPTAELFPTYNIGPQDYGRQRTGLEQLATQPIIGGGYGHKRNLLTGNLDIVPAGTPTVERDMVNRLVTNVQANPYIPVDYQGNRLNCPPGSRAYKGVCLTDEEYAQVQAKEESAIQYREQVAKEEKRKREEEQVRIYNQSLQDYYTKATKRGNKHVKGALDPWETITKEEWEKHGGNKWYNDPENKEYKELFYIDKKDLGNGNYEIRSYPRAAIFGLMSKYGMKPSEFEKYHGINAKNLQKEYEGALKLLNQYYLEQGARFIEEYIKQGYTAEQAKKKLKEDKNYGVTSGINKNFTDVAEYFDIQYNADKYYIDNAGVFYRKTKDGEWDIYTKDINNNGKGIRHEVINPTDGAGVIPNPAYSPFDYEYGSNYWNWAPMDKPKIKSDSKGNLSINDIDVFNYDYTFPSTARAVFNKDGSFKKTVDKRNKNEYHKDYNTIMENYKKSIDETQQEIRSKNMQVTEQNFEQNYYTLLNTQLHDHVYGTNSKEKFEKINPYFMFGYNQNKSYVDAYNKIVEAINKAPSQEDKENIFQEFIASLQGFPPSNKLAIFIPSIKKLQDDKNFNKNINYGSLSPMMDESGRVFFRSNIYSDLDKDGNVTPKRKMEIRKAVKANEAEGWLKYAYDNDIIPSVRNVMDDEYESEDVGEPGSWRDWKDNYEYKDFISFKKSPEGKKFLSNYKRQPSYGKLLVNNIITKRYENQLIRAKKDMQETYDSYPWYGKFADQAISLITHPKNTIWNKWLEGKLQDPFIGLMGSNPTASDLYWINAMTADPVPYSQLHNFDYNFPRPSDIYIDNINKLNTDIVDQFITMVNPFEYAIRAGAGLGKQFKGDADAPSTADNLMNLGFALLPFSKTLKRTMGTKVLTPFAKYVPPALKTGKILPRIGNAVTNLVTPGTALTGYFANHAFVPHTDPVTGETVQGFGTEAFKNIYDGIKFDKNEGLKFDWDKISPSLAHAYMAFIIGKHGYKNVNQFARNLLGKPSLLNIPKNNNLINNNLINNNRRGENYEKDFNIIEAPLKKELSFDKWGNIINKKGGIILPLANRGKCVKTKKPIKTPKIENIKTNITKQLADLSFTNYLNSTAPETMGLIANLKSQGIISPSIPERLLVQYPNLLNLATKKGIQNALTVARYTEPSLVEGVSSSGTKTPLSFLDLKAYIDKGLLGDAPGMAMYSASHIPGMRYGRRDGLSRLPYKTMMVHGREQGTPESLDALYTFPSFSSQPEHIRKGIMSDTYGSYGTLLRYPFDYSGSAMDMFNRFRNFENETAAQSQIMKQTGGREGALPGLMGGFKFSKPLEGWQESGIDPVFFQSWMGPAETPIIGHPGQKVLEPLFTQTKPIIKEMQAETLALQKLYAEGKYDELINKLNNKIKSGDFGSPESNIEQIKIRQKEKSDVAPYIDLSKYDVYEGAPKAFQSKHIDPQTGLISLEGDSLKNISAEALSSYEAFMYFGPLLDAARNKSNIVRTYYSPLRFKFKEGGELPEAEMGWPPGFRGRRKTPTVFGREVYRPKSNYFNIGIKSRNTYVPRKDFTPYVPKIINSPSYVKLIKPKLDLSLLKNYYPDSFSPIRFGDDYKFKGEEWYHIDPESYYPLDNAKKLGFKDANDWLNSYMKGLSGYGSDIFKGIGDFEFEPWSDGWEVRNQMMNAFDGPQWVASNKDFFSKLEFRQNLMKQLEYDMARLKFDDMLFDSGKMDDYMKAAERTSKGLPSYDEELFSHLFPGVSMPNWRSKFTTAQQEDFLQKYVGYNPSVANKGLLSKIAMQNINVGTDKLYTPKSSILTPFKGIDAWRQISSQPGYKNKMGGISMKLSKTEIDKYVKGGYIVEEE